MVRRAMVVLAVLSLMPVVSPMMGASGRPRNVILFGWDGAQRDHVKECLGRKELPNLQKLIDDGVLVDIDIEGKTDTKAGWAQILTGYYPEVTGVYSNREYQPIPKGLSIFERLESHFGPDKFVTAAVIGKSGNVGAAGPTKTRVPNETQISQGTETTAAGGKTVGSQVKQADSGYLGISGDTILISALN